MEVMHRYVEEERVVAPPQENGVITITTTNSNSNDEDDRNSLFENHENVQNNASENSVYYEKNEGTTLQFSFSGKNLDDVDITELANAVLNNQTAANFEDTIESVLNASTHSTDESTITTRGEIVRNDTEVEDDDDDEVIVLEFERAVEKLHTHTAHCPNCQSQVTKVILRRKRRKPESDNVFGCLSCLSIFKKTGDCLKQIFSFCSGDKEPIVGEGGHGSSSQRPGKEPVVGEGHHELGRGVSSQKPGKEPVVGDGPHESGGRVLIANADNQGGCLDVFGIIRGRKSQKAPDSGNSTDGVRQPLLKDPHPSVSRGDDHTDKPPHHPSSVSTGDDHVGIDIHDQGHDIIGTREPEVVPDDDRRPSQSLEILKCIVHGGLMESIASLSVVSSAAAAEATTLNIMAIGVASVISSLFIFYHNLMDLKNENINQHTDRYQQVLGRRGHFLLHSPFAVLSFLVFGIIPPVVYGFTFRETDNKDYKILAVAAAAFISVLVLAIAKAYARTSQKFSEYVKTILYYMTVAVSVSGVAYAAGDLIKILMDRLGWFEQSSTVPANPTWASY